jgi:hypothetical protein
MRLLHPLLLLVLLLLHVLLLVSWPLLYSCKGLLIRVL